MSEHDDMSVDLEHETVHRDGGLVFWAGAILGWAIILLGIRAALNDRELKPGSLFKWIIGGLVLHDALWLPVVAVVGAGLAALTRRRVPVVFGWAAGTTAVLTLIAWPFVRGYGRRADVPSALQRNYASGLLVYVAIVWLLALMMTIAGRIRKRRPPPVTPDRDDALL